MAKQVVWKYQLTNQPKFLMPSVEELFCSVDDFCQVLNSSGKVNYLVMICKCENVSAAYV